MLVAPLGSGSAGNSFWFQSDGTSILVDAGFGPRETKRRMEEVGGAIEQLSGIVITHEHYDHIRGAESIARKFGVPIYLTQGTLDSSKIDPTETRVVVFENNTTFEIGELAVHARRTIHDATDPACFVIESRDGTRVGIASDLGYTDAGVIGHLRNCDGLFFESNHDLDMLRLGTYPWSLKRRIMSRFGHLSNDDAMIALQRMLSAETKTLCMIHLSEKNNTEGIVRDVTTRMIDRLGATAQLELAIARQEAPTKKFDIRRRSVQRAVAASMQFSLF